MRSRSVSLWARNGLACRRIFGHARCMLVFIYWLEALSISISDNVWQDFFPFARYRCADWPICILVLDPFCRNCYLQSDHTVFVNTRTPAVLTARCSSIPISASSAVTRPQPHLFRTQSLYGLAIALRSISPAKGKGNHPLLPLTQAYMSHRHSRYCQNLPIQGKVRKIIVTAAFPGIQIFPQLPTSSKQALKHSTHAS